jgi:hypothetical protein
MPSKPPPVNQLWLKQQFDEIDRQFALVLDRIADLKRQNVLILAEVRKIGGASDNVSPELENLIRTSQLLSGVIDAKVPDQKCK